MEDSEADTALLIHELQRKGYDPAYERVDTRESMAAALERGPWDVVVADYNMPCFNAPEAISLLKAQGLDVPFVILSGSIREETAVAALKAGADDYVMKDNLARLVPAIERELGRVVVRQARRNAEESLFGRVRQQESVAVLGQRALRTNELGELLGYTVSLVTQTLGIEYCKYLELLPDQKRFLLRAGKGWKEGSVGRLTIDGGVRSQAGFTLLQNKPVIVDDLRTDTRFPNLQFLREHNVVSGMSVLVQGRERVFGVLGAHTTSRRTFTKDDINFLQAVANVLAAAIERKQLEEQTFQAQRIEAIQHLAGGMAHHFNNLMAAMIGLSDLLLMRIGKDDELHRYAEQIKSAADRAATLTRQLVEFSRLEPSSPTDLKMSQVLQRLAKLLRTLVGDSIHVDMQTDHDDGTVHVDATQIEQVIVNLVVNARDAMPKGGTLRIATSNIAVAQPMAAVGGEIPPGEYVLLSMSDTGIGIGDEIREHVFEPFFTTKRSAQSTGMGLPTTYGIVKQSGGYIAFDSAPEKGTTFRIYLPKVK